MSATGAPEPTSPERELELRRRIQTMRDDELVDFIRETVVRMDALADRLEVFADKSVENDGENESA